MFCECGSSSVGRASASQAEGHEFESRLPLVIIKGMPQIGHPFHYFNHPSYLPNFVPGISLLIAHAILEK